MVKYILFTFLMVLKTCGSSKSECSVTTFESRYGNIKHYPSNRNNRQLNTKSCGWEIATPDERNHLLFIIFTYLASYQNDDDFITMPDGQPYNGKAIYADTPAQCFRSYVPEESSLTSDCLKELKDSFCSTSSLQVLKQPANVSITTTADNTNSFTDLEFVYIIAACTKSETPAATASSTNTPSFGSSTAAATLPGNTSDAMPSTRENDKSKQSDIDSTVIIAVTSVLLVLLLVCGIIIAVLAIKLRIKDKEHATQHNSLPNVSYNTQHSSSTEKRVDENPYAVADMAEDEQNIQSMAIDDDKKIVYDHLKM